MYMVIDGDKDWDWCRDVIGGSGWDWASGRGGGGGLGKGRGWDWGCYGCQSRGEAPPVSRPNAPLATDA